MGTAGVGESVIVCLATGLAGWYYRGATGEVLKTLFKAIGSVERVRAPRQRGAEHEYNRIPRPEFPPRELVLAVEQPGVGRQEIFVQHGVSLGRGESNTVRIDGAGVELLHAKVVKGDDGGYWLECQTESARIRTASGENVCGAALRPGLSFRIGRASIECLARHVAPPVDPSRDDSNVPFGTTEGVEYLPPPRGRRGGVWRGSFWRH